MTKEEILHAAWGLSRERGLGGWALRDVAEAVGMRAPSLYVYFGSKNALYDAMFPVRPSDPSDLLRTAATEFVAFCVEDPARHQLLFLRPVPGFEPSEASYALAREVLARTAEVLRAAGAGDPEQADLWTALVSGMAAQQVSNDPGGDRWRRLVDRAVEMFVAQLPSSQQPGSG